ncbi:MAG: lectin like domain-containing protein, partial [candidate division Zixibacteria bacterium]|nr:lectin like domain-containing protein [candidate division Zixibacteria bacterium]
NDLRHLDSYGDAAKSTATLPARFDWRTTGKVTSIKNQGACGACYSFATVADIESKMLIAGEGSFDFSENNVKECNVQNTACNGGNYEIVANFLSQNGTVLESCDAYTPNNVPCNSGCTTQKTLTGWRIIAADAVPSTATLQDHIYNNGPVYTALYTGDGNDPAFQTEFNNYDGGYAMYYTGTWTINHAVLIVGWDDDHPHSGGTGAWICKNSWGTSWGGTCDYGAEAGYFYMAYGSASIGKYSSYMSDYMDYDASVSLLAYDDNGWTSQWGYSSPTGWGLCVFPIATQQFITHVEFWTSDITLDVDVYIYDSFNGSSLSTLLASELDNNYAQAGYHSVALSSPPQISAGDDIVAVVKFENASYIYPIVADANGSSETGATYISGNGGSGTWTDLGAYAADDVGIRVRTSPTLALDADDDPTATPYRWSLSHNYPNPFNPSTNIHYSLASRSHVTITIYNVLGQEVNVLVDEVKSAGEYDASWDGSDFGGRGVASGIYFYRMVADDHTETAKMVLLR